jgi:hypothetical protein
MDEHRDTFANDHQESSPPGTHSNFWLVSVAIAALAAAGVAFGYGYQQQNKVGQLAAQESAANATINDLQRQLGSMTDRLNAMTAQQQAQEQAQQQATEVGAQNASKPAAKSNGVHPANKQGAESKRYKQLQAQLAEQQKQLKETQDLVAKNRADLEGSLNSTRDELNGSIAKTHEELVALAKRGERSYFEFDLSKSKNFQRVGPLALSLRKADTKHKSFDMQLIVDDNQLTKKKVNLYEPVWIHTENESQPVQVVANRIDKDHIHGYVSAPKYKPSELATVSSNSVTPVAGHENTPPLNTQNAAQPQQ